MPLTLKALETLGDTPPWDWPKDTGPDLLQVLRNKAARENELLLAVELAGNSVVVDDDLVHALLAILRGSSASELVRGRAAIALGPVLELGETDGFEDPDWVPISEKTFREIQEVLRMLYFDTSVPKLVRRRVLEASVRAPMDWHWDAIRAAYASDDEEWKLTAVFGMQYVRGFEEQILSALKSKNLPTQVEAVWAAGAWPVDAAWPHIVQLVSSKDADRTLLLAAITAVGEIRPDEAPQVLEHLSDSDDPDIAEAVIEATAMAGDYSDEEDDDLDDLDDDEGPDSHE
ncbi:MAG TPA: HEAT repeat domain-containing protein [Anaeromyxobacteraceae bacterium]|nr:HEAT repeat domain-containing protein [Anaeromyxobacteraceae bacterium]